MAGIAAAVDSQESRRDASRLEGRVDLSRRRRDKFIEPPGKLAPILAAEADRHRIRQILDAEIEEALNELSAQRFDVTGGADD